MRHTGYFPLSRRLAPAALQPRECASFNAPFREDFAEIRTAAVAAGFMRSRELWRFVVFNLSERRDIFGAVYIARGRLMYREKGFLVFVDRLSFVLEFLPKVSRIRARALGVLIF